MDGDRPSDGATRRNDVDEEPPHAAPRGLLGALKGVWRKSPEDPALAEALAESTAHTETLSRAKREMIERVIAFDEKRVEDVMAPRADIIAVEAETPLPDLVKAFSEAGHSRLPIYRGDLDDPVGMVHLKDVIGLLADPARGETLGPGPILPKLRREILYAPPSMSVTDLLLKMQAVRVHMALVIDEFGGTDGLVTIEDLVEEIVGDINDEHDTEEDEPTLTERAGGGWEADARYELDAFEAATGCPLPAVDEDIDTLGGLVFSLAGRVPQRGEVIRHPAGLEFEIADADPRRVRKLRIRALALPNGADSAVDI